ncbi:MAG: hypothetical protein K2P81_17380 [Bacteriovoracaceae bacterium]|nr:hypothetical protein [Bacteriovoracaceae bacterium]
MKTLILFVILTFASSAMAQINIGQIFGGGNSNLKIDWSCQQQNYPEIKQLRNSANVKIEAKLKNGELEISFKPNIFQVQPISLEFVTGVISNQKEIGVDYSDCIEQFEKSYKQAISTYKNQNCASSANNVFCQRTSEDLLDGFKRQIRSEKYFVENLDRVNLPRLLPNQKTGSSPKEIQDNLNNFCSQKSFSKINLYSSETLQLILNNSTDVRIGVSQDCMKRIQSELEKDSNALIGLVCEKQISLCNKIKEANIQGQQILAKSLENSVAATEKEDERWAKILMIPQDDKGGSNDLKERLNKDPFQCSQLGSSLKTETGYYPMSALPSSLAENMQKLSEVADGECLRTVIQNYALGLAYVGFDREEFQKYCQENSSKLCKEMEERKKLSDKNLRDLFALTYGDLGKRFVTECDDCLDSPAKSLQQLINKVKEAKEAVTCIDLKVGEAKVVSSFDGAPAGLSGNYSLKKRADGGFDVKVGMNVVSDGAFGVSADEMLQRVQKCISEVTPYMKGANGNILNLQVLSGKELSQIPASERPRLNNISIQGPNTRSNSGSYEANVDCPTITHEVLHLLGLCDEYDGTGDGYTCRAAPKVASIMSSQNAAFEKAVPKTFNCECKVGSTCRKIMEGQDEAHKNFYMMANIYSTTDYKFRNQYCNDKELPQTTWSAIAQNPYTVYEKTSSENDITIVTQNSGDIYPAIERSEFKCKCATGDNKCQTQLNEFKAQVAATIKTTTPYCPSGSNWTQPQIGNKLNSESPYKWTGSSVQFVTKPEWPSLIHANHFERIAGGACASKASKYNECAKWAYRGKENTNNCSGKPLYCEDDQEFLGVSAK